MGIGNFFKDLLGTADTESSSTFRYSSICFNDDDLGYTASGELMRNALEVATDYIAACIAKCEIQTYCNNNYEKGSDWYRWNVKPNLNQGSTEFWTEIVKKLIKSGEVLILPINDQLVVADSFAKNEKALVPTNFSGISRGSYTIQGIYNTTNSIYVTRENNANLNRLVAGLGTVLDGILKIACERYYREDGEHGIVKYNTPQSLNDDEKEVVLQDLNDYFEDFYAHKNGVAVLFDDMSYTPLNTGTAQKSSVITDIQNITKEAYSKVAQALKVPPALLLGDTANINSVVIDNLIQFAVMPILDDVVEKANAVMYTPEEYLSGNFLKVDYAGIKYLDMVDCAASLDKLRADGLYNVNELRVKFGETPVKQDFAESYIITKNYADVKDGDKE